VKNAKEKQMNGRMREGTAGIFRKGFAVFALAGLLAAAAVMTGCEDALAALGGDEDSKNTEEQANYDENGWNLDDLTDNTNENGTLFSDVDGLDRQGYDVNGWNGKDLTDMQNKNGTLYGADGYDREGYDTAGYDKDGYDIYGWNEDGHNKVTDSAYDAKGFKQDGTYKETNSLFANDDDYGCIGLDRDGYNEAGWNVNNDNKTTGTKFDSDGYDVNGLNANGFDANKDYKGKTGVKYADDDTYGNQGYDVDGYNEEGWNKQHINKVTETAFDEAGYDYEGYDADGYNAQGVNRQNQPRPAKLAGLNGNEVFADSGKTKDIAIPTTRGSISLATVTSGLSGGQDGINGMFNAAATELVGQSVSLAYAYKEVADQYSSLQIMANAIATNEKAMAVGAYTTLTDWKTYDTTYGDNITAIWNAVFNGKTDAKTKFDAYLAAYKAGLASNQSVRSEQRTELDNAFSAAITALNTSPYNETLTTPSTGGQAQAKTNNAAIIATLKTKLLEQINDAMEVDDKVSIAADQTTLKNLNEILLQQTGDVEELRAFVADVNAIPSASYNVNYSGGKTVKSVDDEFPDYPSGVPVGSNITTIPTSVAMGTQKLNDLINGFDPEYLKLKQQVAGKDEIALV
jgi:hypothetical protein